MAHFAIIYETGFSAMAEPMPSSITLRVVVTGLHVTAIIHDSGMIPDLARKYQFKAEEHHWDLSSMHKRDCIIDYDDKDVPYFVGYR